VFLAAIAHEPGIAFGNTGACGMSRRNGDGVGRAWPGHRRLAREFDVVFLGTGAYAAVDGREAGVAIARQLLA